jgi:hypothetical protein
MTKTFKIIPVEDRFVMIENSSPEKNELCLFKDDTNTWIDEYLTHVKWSPDIFKIIAHTGIDSLKDSELPLFEIPDNVDKLAKEWTKSRGYSNFSLDDKHLWSREQTSFKAGYKAGGKYTEEDMRNAIDIALSTWINREQGAKFNDIIDKVIKSLKKIPVSADVEMEVIIFTNAHCSAELISLEGLNDYFSTRLPVDKNNYLIIKQFNYE